MYWAFPLAVGIATLKAAIGLNSGLFSIELTVDLFEVFNADDNLSFRRVLSRCIQKLEVVFAHIRMDYLSHSWMNQNFVVTRILGYDRLGIPT